MDDGSVAKMIGTDGGNTKTPMKGITAGRTESVKRGVQRSTSGDGRDHYNNTFEAGGSLGSMGSGGRTDVDDHDLKYVRRDPAHTRMFQKVIGVTPSLPVTSMEAEVRGGGMQGGRAGRG